MDSSNHTGSDSTTGVISLSPHVPVTVTNVSKPDITCSDISDVKELKKEEISPTPQKMPAKLVFPKKDDAVKKEVANNIMASGSMLDHEEGFHDFLQRVAMVQQQEAFRQAVEQRGHTSHAPASPQVRRNSPSFTAMLPEYAMYQEARYQRALSRGNSFSNLNASPSGSPRMTTSPRVEWVPNPVAMAQRAWDEHSMMTRHAFPSAIFCGRHEDSGVPPPVPPIPPMNEYNMYPSYPNSSSSDLSDGVSLQEHFRHSRAYTDGSTSIPSAAALSERGSSSSWSEEDERHHSAGTRQFLDALGGSCSSRAHAARSQHSRRNSGDSCDDKRSSTDNLVEISPGVHEPLRGANETVRAVRQDFYVPVSCFGCSQDIFSIADAKYVICPECRVVGPIEKGAWDGKELEQHGLGLGFSCESLFQMQADILSER